MRHYQSAQPARPAAAGRALAALALAGWLAACGTPGEGEGRIEGVVEGFAGMVAADEPHAAVIARDVLANGGNAADAAVAMYFALAVTLPSRAGLGGGGSCAVFDNGDKAGQSLDFLPRAGAVGGVVPTGPRAMAALHARQGLLRWEGLLTPAENLARFGHPVSRAFAADLAVARPLIEASPELSKIFRGESGRLPGEGEQIVQFELAGVIGGLRTQGAGYFYGGGPFADRFVQGTAEAGLPVAAAELREAAPILGDAPELRIGKDRAYFTGAPSGGLIAAQIYALLTEEASWGTAGPGEQAHLLAEAAMRAFAQRSGWLGEGGTLRADTAGQLSDGHLSQVFAGYSAGQHTPAESLTPAPRFVAENPAGTGFAVADRFGNAVACGLTMNGLFGSGELAAGILLANRPEGRDNGLLSLAAVVVGNTNTGDFRFAAASGAGGVSAPAALARVMLGALAAEQPLAQAIAAPRVHHGGAPDETYHEPGLDAAARTALQQRGHALSRISQLGQVEALHCPLGVLDRSVSCVAATDPRGAGLAMIVR